MGIKKTLGGDRLGTGKKMTVELENFGRSTFNLNKVIRFDQAFGTLVPAYCNINLNGGTFYIGVNAMAKTLPTNGPIMGRAKYQIDFFQIPIRLYIAQLHNNALGIGMAMNKVFLPRFIIEKVPKIDFSSDVEPNRQQVAQDSLLAHIGIRGLGSPTTENFSRSFPALFMLAYWDTYKNYYSNKQEEIGCVIKRGNGIVWGVSRIIVAGIVKSEVPITTTIGDKTSWGESGKIIGSSYEKKLIIKVKATKSEFLNWFKYNGLNTNEAWDSSEWSEPTLEREDNDFQYWSVQYTGESENEPTITMGNIANKVAGYTISVEQFELTNIDQMRERILAAPKGMPFSVNDFPLEPYKTNWENYGDHIGCYFTMAGLGLKTYMSDRFNNWLSTEWIDGVNGVNDITAVDVSDGKLTMNALILSKKLFNMLNRIAISDGSYVSWQESVWGVRAVSMAESPVYCGGMAFDIVFDEVVSNSASVDAAGDDQPLGTLAGRGMDARKRGGKVKIKASEPCMIMAIASCTPYIDYSQGNKWWNELETMDDFHKPDLDRIGFQELLTEEFAAADTKLTGNDELEKNSVGKQTSWIEYQTDVNETFGDFAVGGALEWMTFNRRYHYDENGALEDATTYIDPTIFNVAFADTELATKPLWMQIAFNIEARRVMGAKQIPNL